MASCLFGGLLTAACLAPAEDDVTFPGGGTGGSDGLGGSGGSQTTDLPEDPPWCASGVAEGRRLARDVRVTSVSAYQAVAIPLVENGREVEKRNADLVQGRDLLVRVFVEPDVDPLGLFERRLTGRLLISTEGAPPVAYEDVRSIRRPSSLADLDTTFNFRVPGQALRGQQSFAVEVVEDGPCNAPGSIRSPRFPADGELNLDARVTGPVRVTLVPIRYDADGSGRLPDLSDDNVGQMRSLLETFFPTTGLELTVRDTVGTTEDDFGSILNQLIQLRELDEPPDDVAYFGLVSPAESMSDYCRGGCVAGVATFGTAGGQAGTGLGVGFTGSTAETFVHELGHVHRLMHTPCGGPPGLDPDYPYQGGSLGSWGYDPRDAILVDPSSTRRDFMSYCDPTWISDYSYQLLVERLSLVQALRLTDQPRSEPVVYRSLLVSADGESRWGLPIPMRQRPPGELESAEVLDGRGRHLTDIEVYRQDMSEGHGSVYYVPQPSAPWHSLRVARGRAAHAFGAPRRARAFQPVK